MRIPGMGRARRAVRVLRNRARPGVLILLYHRIVELDRDPYRLCVSPLHFAEHLEILQRRRLVISLRDLVKALQENSVPRRAVVITFDDGYVDNLENAKPLLDRYQTPATVFVVSGNVGNDREFWWDELERILLGPGTLPGELDLEVGGKSYHWSLGKASAYSRADATRSRAWHLYQDKDPVPRHTFFRSIHNLVRSVPLAGRWSLLDQLAAWADAGLKGRESHRALDREGLRMLAAGGMVEVGAHTVTHPVLSSLPADIQRREIRESKAALQEILGCPVTSFAYPHGSRSDYTSETISMTREEGFECAVSVYSEKVKWDTDRYQLPRVLVDDWPGDEFARHLEEWQRS